MPGKQSLLVIGCPGTTRWVYHLAPLHLLCFTWESVKWKGVGKWTSNSNLPQTHLMDCFLDPGSEVLIQQVWPKILELQDLGYRRRNLTVLHTQPISSDWPSLSHKASS